MSENKNVPEPQAPVDENQIIAERRAKLTELRKHGNAYPKRFPARMRSPRTCTRSTTRSPTKNWNPSPSR